MIAVRLQRDRSTIYREIKRNRFVDEELPELNGYYGVLAQKTASQRRHRRRKLVRCADLLGAVLEGLDAGRSPEQIAGRMRRERQPRSVSHETIYAYLYSSFAGIWVMRADHAARLLSASRLATPSLKMMPSTTNGNWFALVSRCHFLAAA